MLCWVWRESYIGRESGVERESLGCRSECCRCTTDNECVRPSMLQVEVGKKHEPMFALWWKICQSHIRTGQSNEAERAYRRVLHTPIIPTAQTWTFVFRCIARGIMACRFQDYWYFLFFFCKRNIASMQAIKNTKKKRKKKNKTNETASCALCSWEKSIQPTVMWDPVDLEEYIW